MLKIIASGSKHAVRSVASQCVRVCSLAGPFQTPSVSHCFATLRLCTTTTNDAHGSEMAWARWQPNRRRRLSAPGQKRLNVSPVSGTKRTKSSIVAFLARWRGREAGSAAKINFMTLTYLNFNFIKIYEIKMLIKLLNTYISCMYMKFDLL